MEVKIILHGILREHLPREARGRITLDLPEGATIDQVLERLKIGRTVAAVVDGVQVETNQVLHHDADLQLFRPLGGG